MAENMDLSKYGNMTTSYARTIAMDFPRTGEKAWGDK